MSVGKQHQPRVWIERSHRDIQYPQYVPLIDLSTALICLFTEFNGNFPQVHPPVITGNIEEVEEFARVSAEMFYDKLRERH